MHWGLLFLIFTIICVIYHYFVQENEIIEIIVNVRNNYFIQENKIIEIIVNMRNNSKYEK